MAVTNPIYVIAGGQPIRSQASADYFVKWIDKLTAMAAADKGWRSDKEKAHVLGQFRRRATSTWRAARRPPPPAGRNIPSSRRCTATVSAFCPVCGSAARAARAEDRRADAARLHQRGLRVRLLPRPEAGRRHHHRACPTARIVLARRAIEPGHGLWVFPGGYVDRGEEVRLAAVREAREEAGIDIRLDGLVGIYSYPGTTAGDHRLPRRRGSRGALAVDDESSEIRTFDAADAAVGRAGVPQHARLAARLPGRGAPPRQPPAPPSTEV